MRFKNWLETLSGPGGGPEPQSDRPDKMAMQDIRLGVGAWNVRGKKSGKENKQEPPPTGDSPCLRYDPNKKN